MFPTSFLQQTTTFNLQIDGLSMRATLMLSKDQLVSCLFKLYHSPGCLGSFPLVAFDLKRVNGKEILLLYSGHDCIVVPLSRFDDKLLLNDDAKTFKGSLGNFLSNTNLCFVGKNVSDKISSLRRRNQSLLATAVEVNLFAARIFKNPELKKCTSLKDLGKKIGLDLGGFKQENKPISNQPDWDDLCLTEDDVMAVIREVYVCYKIADFARKKLDEKKKR